MESLLQNSTLIYRKMLSFLDGVRHLDLEQPKALLAAQEQFTVLQGEVEEIDGRINSRFAQNGISSELMPLLKKRQEVLREVAETNRQVAPRLIAMMAVLQAELKEIRTGMNTVAGYAQGSRVKIQGFRAEG